MERGLPSREEPWFSWAFLIHTDSARFASVEQEVHDFTRTLMNSFSYAQLAVPPLSESGQIFNSTHQLTDQLLSSIAVPELLCHVISSWPGVPDNAEAVVIKLEAKLELEQSFSEHLARRYAWLELGLMDKEGTDIVQRIRCNVRINSAADCRKDGKTSLVARRPIDSASDSSRQLLRAVSKHLFSSDEDVSLAVWARADGPLTYNSSLEFVSARLELIYNTVDDGLQAEQLE
eukprot:TRINITY_DN30882_c0_g1_i4.p1 TRINITY_DN30882_c0_g1~~TRINITY_DN30882_c0_g1_i4.p1  ORF type:complete len:233 (+),score=14.77 TRINITY_DN30882_c0_g1_i4:274-972(+)